MIEVEGIAKRYGSHMAVDHISFTMEKGRIYGFLGPNGAGKSTTMNIMTGYIAPSEGTVLIDGIDIQKKPKEVRKKIGYLPEIPPLYPDMTVMEYLTFAAELKGVAKAVRRDEIAAVLKQTMLGDLKDRLIRNLSKGYKQRVGLAQALLGSPEVIILDEPTVGLDPQQITEIRDLIRSLKNDHIVMLSSHILSEVNEVCDTVMILSHGRLVASGSPEDLENMLQKTTVLDVTVLGAEEAVRQALDGVPQIRSLSFQEPGPDGSISFTIEMDEPDRNAAGADSAEAVTAAPDETAEADGSGEAVEHQPAAEDVRAVIARALAAASLPVMSMNVKTQSLEDVFLELTAQGAAPVMTETPAETGDEQQSGEDAEDMASAGESDDEASSADKTTTDASGEEVDHASDL